MRLSPSPVSLGKEVTVPLMEPICSLLGTVTETVSVKTFNMDGCVAL